MSRSFALTAQESLGAILEKNMGDRRGLPITWIVGEDGVRLPLSRYGDDVVDFTPYISNPAAGTTAINLSALPNEWRDSYLDVILNFWRFGRPGSSAPKASTVVRAAHQLSLFVRWLSDRGISRFADVRPLHATTFANYLHDSPITAQSREGELRKNRGVGNVLWATTLPWDLRARIADAMPGPPFEEESGITKASRSSKRGPYEASTYCMSLHEFSTLFQACECSLEHADEYIAALEMRHKLLSKESNKTVTRKVLDDRFRHWLKSNLGISTYELNARIKLIREAAATELALLVGQRVSEVLSLECGCYFERELEGASLGWLKGRTYKTSQNTTTWTDTEWLAPTRVAVIVSYLERLSAVIRPVLHDEIAAIRHRIQRAKSTNEKAQLSAKLMIANRSLNSIFLTRSVSKGFASHESVRIVSHGTFALWLRAMAKKAGLSCPINPHVFRRTFAYMVVRHCNADIRYLKVHFQHWTLETTQLYATHDSRDEDLADEIGQSILDAKTDLVSTWLDQDEILAGAAGEHIRHTREKPEFQAHTLKDRKALARSLHEGLNIRPTGHSWCVAAGSPPCGGRGLYDASECASGCGSAVISEREIPVWKQLTIQLLAAESLDDSGPGGAQLVARSLAVFDDVLKPFGLSVAAIKGDQEKLKHVDT